MKLYINFLSDCSTSPLPANPLIYIIDAAVEYHINNH